MNVEGQQLPLPSPGSVSLFGQGKALGLLTLASSAVQPQNNIPVPRRPSPRAQKDTQPAGSSDGPLISARSAKCRRCSTRSPRNGASSMWLLKQPETLPPVWFSHHSLATLGRQGCRATGRSPALCSRDRLPWAFAKGYGVGDMLGWIFLPGNALELWPSVPKVGR